MKKRINICPLSQNERSWLYNISMPHTKSALFFYTYKGSKQQTTLIGLANSATHK